MRLRGTVLCLGAEGRAGSSGRNRQGKLMERGQMQWVSRAGSVWRAPENRRGAPWGWRGAHGEPWLSSSPSLRTVWLEAVEGSLLWAALGLPLLPAPASAPSSFIVHPPAPSPQVRLWEAPRILIVTRDKESQCSCATCCSDRPCLQMQKLHRDDHATGSWDPWEPGAGTAINAQPQASPQLPAAAPEGEGCHAPSGCRDG